MQSLEIVLVGQFHKPAEFRFDRAEGRRVQRLLPAAGADATAPVERTEAVRVTRSALCMQSVSFQRLARIVTTAVAFRDWYELLTSISGRRHQNVSACTFA